ncbi:transcription elongation factor GreA [Patescibacteria group bacterium]|nr:transcription elongation factor GreA [Patescibacteria group bacterium]
MPETTDQAVLTAAGLDKLKAELKDLKDTRRPAVLARIKEAISYGDLSENSEYEDAKNEQAFVEGRITELNHMLENPKIVKANAGEGGKVTLGSTVKVKTGGSSSTFTVVGPTDANPDDGMISHESPLGEALVGAAVGESVEVETPRGATKYHIVSIGKK